MFDRFRPFVREHRGILLLVALLFAARLMALAQLGIGYTLDSDDASYILSGIRWAETGAITMHNDYPSAQIMPGMTVLIGLFAKVFGAGTGLWLALKLLWAAMGAASGWFIYRAVDLLTPPRKWYSLAAVLPLFRADFIWADSLILTETPFFLALSAMICFTFRMGEKQDWASFWGCLTAWLWGLMLKANIGLYPLFALAYLLLKKYDLRLLVRQCLTLGAVTLCILVPWTVRNWHHFGAFIPLTYGSGNPTLLGTYQGAGFPPDGELDYDTHVEQAARDQYADYYGPDGAPLPQFERYINLQKDGLKARYRQQVWWETYPLSMLGSYLVAKPQNMINSVFYWDEILDTPKSWLLILQRVDLWLCIFTVAAALHLKKQRLPVLFLAGTYLCNIYIYAMTFSFDRYNAGLMPLRFILVGIGLDLMIRLPARWIREAPSE